MTAALISIIGPPAVGKTTLAERLSVDMPAELIREDYASNPFLAESYAGNTQADLPSQLYFLLSRVSQLELPAWPDEGVLVSDYAFCQDPVFAALRLDRDDLRTYERVLSRVKGLVHPPDVLIHLDAAEGTLLARIAKRGRSFEEAITAEFLAGMRCRYNEVASTCDRPVVAIDCDTTDIRCDKTLADIVGRIREKL
jgi:deoxyguanosine kinase